MAQTHRDGPGEGVASLRDVAASAGVSVSTASRVLSGSSHPVSESTRKLVLDTADRLGFEPNRVARALATARTQTIGVVVHDISDPYFAEIVRGLEDVAGPSDHAIFVASANRDLADELALIKAFAANRVDAIALVASGVRDDEYEREVTRLLARFEERGGVVVKLSEHPYPAPGVRYDNIAGMTAVVEHLVELGHTRIGHISGPPQLLVSEQRSEGYRRALIAAGIEVDPHLDECGWFSMDGGAQAIDSLMGRASPTAVAAGNDLMAIGAMRHLLDSGLRVPDDVSVAGFDDIEFSSYASVPLTTVHVPLRDLGRIGAGQILALVGGESAAVEDAVAPVNLVTRSSTGRCPV